MSGDHNMNQKFPNSNVYYTDTVKTYAEGVMAERQRIINLLMVQHEAAKGSHNYWHVAANLIKAESGENV